MGVPISLIVAVGVPELLGSLVGQSTRENLLNWFATLRKPSWEPPGPLFGIAWTILYGFMGYASWLVWLQGGFQAQQRALTLYVIQLTLNLSWPLIFFNAKRLGAALAVNLTVLATAAATASAFYKVDPLAGKLLLPYVAWLAFANALNLSILQKNPDATSSVEDLSRGADKANPGESRYGGSTPGSATASMYDPYYQSGGTRSRQRSVRVHCGPAPAVQPRRATATRSLLPARRVPAPAATPAVHRPAIASAVHKPVTAARCGFA